MFSLRQMAFFDALARELHFGRAADVMHVTQPAMSAQIAEMERKIGNRLFERQHGAVILTDTGKRLLPLIRDIFERSRRLENFAESGPETLNGRFRIGMIPTVAPYLLPVLLPKLVADYPKLELKVREAITEHLISALRDGELDAVVAAIPLNESGILHAHLFRDRFHIAAAENTADILTSPVTQDTVAVERLLLLEEGHCLRDQALAVCTAAAQRRLINFGATSMTTLLQMVAHGMGVTLLPEIAIAAETSKAGGLQVTEFASPAPFRDIALFWRKSSERTNDLEALAEVIREASRTLLKPAETEDDRLRPPATLSP